MGIGFPVVLLLTIWISFHPDLKGFSESPTAAQVQAKG
jgi:hypothetical protein